LGVFAFSSPLIYRGVNRTNRGSPLAAGEVRCVQEIAEKAIVILTSTKPQIQGYWISAYKGIVQGQTLDELLWQAEEIGANAVLNTCFDDALDADTLFHESVAVLKREPTPSPVLRRHKRRETRQSFRSDR
jgi:hypothetical protein